MTTAWRILLVGASGRLGRLLAAGWRDRTDFQVCGQYRRDQGVAGLVWDPAEGSTALESECQKRGPFDAMVVVAGAVPGRGQTAEHRSMADDVLSAAHRLDIAKVLIASSAAVYGAQGPGPFSELRPCAPTSAYGQDKLAMEAVVNAWRKRGVNACALRIGNVAGADALLDYERGAQQRTIDLFPDGRGPVRSWIDGKQLAATLADLVVTNKALPPALNLASDPPCAMNELADIAGIDWVARPVPAEPSQSLTLDLGLLRTYSQAARDDISAFALIANWLALKDKV